MGRLGTLWVCGAVAGCAGAPAEPPLPRAFEAPALPPGPGPGDAAFETPLARYRAARAAWRTLAPRPRGPWPLPVLSAWRRLLREVGPIFAAPPPGPAAPRLFVAIESELDRCARRFGPPPDVVGAAWTRARHQMARARGWRRERRRPEPRIEWPVTPVIVTSGFGHRRDPLHGEVGFHAGLDLGGRQGDVVITAAPGRVVATGWHRGYGRRVVIRHGPRLETWYGHLSRILVRAGDRVLPGDAVGFMGASGRTTGPHLHFEVREDDAPVDPHAWVGRPLSEARSLEISRR